MRHSRALMIGAGVMVVCGAAWAQSLHILPGQWEMTGTVTAMHMPGAPPQMASMMGRPMVIKQCVTAQQVAAGPRALMNTQSGCTYTHFDDVGGHLDFAMVCKRGPETTTSTSTGTYSPTSWQTVAHVSSTRGMMMTVTSSAHRIGNCTP